MRAHLLALLVTPLLAATSALAASTSTSTAEIPRMRPARVFEDVKIKRPIQIVVRPDRPDLLYVVEQPGR
ncbi:MAG: hypothetical protein O2927_05595, partial [Planctomycetota bacterium]|nr:hypothetical protein [Planctomycetota bacterium]